ncbi:MAG: xanthine dehydrogenase family protein subunit M [Streptosporangiales bacterium]|nr:xanthine dehydrogenase family protein subunit M [Streptosporangiales bacterium]
MIPAQFEYTAPTTVDEAVSALAQGGEEAKVLAGGQSLMPLLRLRLAYPELLVDLNRVAELRGVRDEGDSLVIGAMTTHHTVVRDPLVNQHCALIALATATVADPAVRHRGTFGGSLAHADPAGDLPAVTVALDAEMIATGPNGQRTIPAGEFFADYLTSTLQPGEILVGVRVPKLAGWGFHYEKFNRVAQAWAVVGVAAAVRRANGNIAEARVGLTNMGATPVRARAVESAVQGTQAAPAALHEAASQAAEGTHPPSDLHGQADYRRHLAQVLTGRALAAAARV